ncbi:MAG: sulfurtransferase TusA family protein [Candidatus Nitrosocaldus sp.]|nr:sulfurtransferase TusA family protein [Candidatus Nitrosocaldus sp.]MDW8275296.1 sulfurtransferase TusA family protein [Candidatus Nitrosocaldus sp.]
MIKVENCAFDEALLYDLENLVWVRVEGGGAEGGRFRGAQDVYGTLRIRIGITSILAYVAGRLTSVRIRAEGTEVERGKSIASIESPKYFGVVRSPARGRIVQVNRLLQDRPKIANDDPYGDGWIALMDVDSSSAGDLGMLEPLDRCRDRLAERIREMHVRCFSAFPDHEMFEIGVECAAVIPKLDELVSRIERGEVVHVVSDDPTADIEIVRWSEERGHELLEIRREDPLIHMIVRKV